MDSNFKLPTETIDLPSKGLLYSKDNPLSSGKVELKYMTAKEEDILTNQNFIEKGTVIDKLLKSLIVTEGVDYDSILIGDKNAIMFAARVLAYGKDYTVELNGKEVTIDLSTLDHKEINEDLLQGGKNEFEFDLPSTGNKVTFKILTHKDEVNIDREITGQKKISKTNSTSSTTRMKHIITSVNGLSEPKDVRNFVDNYLLASDARALRSYYTDVTPDIDMTFYNDDTGKEESIPIGVGFFWPDAG